ncbi:MAG: tetratricopeptide repeat protein [Bacteroidetes bacterium]|nr:tetratricopeptide repeat protein [Bacteroidota bacterium]
MYKIVIVFIFSAFLLVSCNNTNNEVNSNKEVSIEYINTLEAELFNANMTTPDFEKAKQLADMYVAYADQNPNDSIAPDFLFKAADINMNVSSPQTTIALFNNIISLYPEYKNIPTIMFLKGFVYEDQLNDYENARKYYVDFLEKYPNSDFADDALVSLNNLGKSPEELIKEFEKQNNENK